MCCFSRPVQEVSRTRIFARPTLGIRQVVVYQMEFAAEESLAMILPVPVKSGEDPEQFKFINLSAYPEFFTDLNSAFPGAPFTLMSSSSLATRSKPLKVVSVGSFEASFVPRLEDFSRLDPRFRIDATVWRKLPGYDRMGFAVFKLKPGRQEVHPMCFSFPRADPARLFFPTLHIHDGTVHPRESFDHSLYAQGNDRSAPEVLGWEESRGWASQFMKTQRTAGILHNDAHVYRRRLSGEMANEDTYIPLA